MSVYSRPDDNDECGKVTRNGCRARSIITTLVSRLKTMNVSVDDWFRILTSSPSRACTTDLVDVCFSTVHMKAL